jgi:prepilin-type N-terminal cleavage/methylation domain-containing protein
MPKNQKGFTIIELIVVIAIIALLSGIVATNVTKYINKAKEARANTEAKNIEKALLAFYSKYGDYPCNSCWEWEWGWGPWKYIYPGNGNPYLDTVSPTAYLFEFYKVDYDSPYNAIYLSPTARYDVNLSDSNGDGKIDCGYIYLYDDFYFYGQKGIICADTNCLECLPENQYPFQATPY